MLQKESAGYGQLFHYLLEQAYNPSLDFNRDQFINVYLPKWLEEWKKKNINDVDAQVLEDILGVAEAVFPSYVDVWLEDWSVRKWVSLEAEFTQQWEGYMLHGYRDGIFEQNGKTWILETKTKSRIDGNLEEAIGFDGQILLYVVATEAHPSMQGKKITGVLYNVIRKPGLKRKAEESFQEYAQRIKDDIQKDHAHYFKRYEITFSEPEKERFRQELRYKLQDYTAWLQGKLTTYRNENSCIGIFNCQYLSMCSSGSTVGYKQVVKP